MSVLKNKIRWWWIEKPTENNLPIQAVFEAFQPTIRSRPETEWVRVISLDDFHKEAGMNITRWVEICQQLADTKKRLEEMSKARDYWKFQYDGEASDCNKLEAFKKEALEVIGFYENCTRLMMEARDLPTEDHFGMPLAYESLSMMENGDRARSFLQKHTTNK